VNESDAHRVDNKSHKAIAKKRHWIYRC
jgi:hypothetical protein